MKTLGDGKIKVSVDDIVKTERFRENLRAVRSIANQEQPMTERTIVQRTESFIDACDASADRSHAFVMLKAHARKLAASWAEEKQEHLATLALAAKDRDAISEAPDAEEFWRQNNQLAGALHRVEEVEAYAEECRRLLDRIADRAYMAKLYRYNDRIHTGNLEFAAEQVREFLEAHPVHEIGIPQTTCETCGTPEPHHLHDCPEDGPHRSHAVDTGFDAWWRLRGPALAPCGPELCARRAWIEKPENSQVHPQEPKP